MQQWLGEKEQELCEREQGGEWLNDSARREVPDQMDTPSSSLLFSGKPRILHLPKVMLTGADGEETERYCAVSLGASPHHEI